MQIERSMEFLATESRTEKKNNFFTSVSQAKYVRGIIGG